MMLTDLLPTLYFTWTVNSGSVLQPCDQNVFHSDVGSCWSGFNRTMEDSRYQETCPWPDVKHSYNKLRLCVEEWVKASSCAGSRFLADELFLNVHRTYFTLCGRVHDPSLLTLIMLISPGIIATLFIPFLCVHLTTSNT